MLHLSGGWASGILNDSPQATLSNKIETVFLNSQEILQDGLEPVSEYTLHHVELDLTSFPGDFQYFLGFRRQRIGCNEGERGMKRERGRRAEMIWIETNVSAMLSESS